MNAQQNSASEKEDQLTLELLQAIEREDNVSQRHLAQTMGVALGLANSYLKRCVKKGLIKMKTAPANRYLYYLTPMGFAEKARLTGEFLSTSLTLFRQSGDVYNELFDYCIATQKTRIVLVGLSDLTEIAYLRSLQNKIEIIGVYQPEADKEVFFELPVLNYMPLSSDYDYALMTSLEQTEELIEQVVKIVGEERVLTPSFLGNMNYRHQIDQAVGN